MQQAGMGHLIRQARQAKGWTQSELGSRIGYNKTRVSRAETGTQPIRDVTVLRRLADVLGVPPSMFGLADRAPTLASDLDMSASEASVDRRAFLGVAGAVGVSAAFPIPAAADEPDPATLLEKRISACLFTTPGASAVPMPVVELQAGLARAQAGYNACRYVWLSGELPRLISAADATMAATPTAGTAALASASYQLAAHALAKLLVSGLQPMAADRAVHRAHQANDPLVLAQARRVLSTAARRIGDYDQAERVGIRAIEDLPLTHQDDPIIWRHAVELWCVAGYAAAIRGDRDRFVECYREAAAVAAQINDHHQQRQARDYALAHQISSAYKLGDSATALDAARQVRLDVLPTTERKGRYLIDLAMAWQQHGHDNHASRALLLADYHAPGEVRTRSSARRLISSLATSSRSRGMPELVGLARRAHVAL
ncbi:transcriptional regulator [Saccharomonospora piscinae]|uniref:Transcriptional regulator n=1 Tax=Saccharomonospora piscinae TaxID=687388 RepID=A0A1V8ZXF1_SACPI|nr:helix-turn-helix transcriptional regulator [Saccharomonospora piscinae]OQO89627.1 transcriptional regulator [Saccharomonospora piscinae]